MRDCNVITNNGLEDETPDNDVKCIYKEVVIIGNGPSGITLSYLLSGHRPYYNRIPHPDPMLSARLIECTQKSLLHQDLSFLSQGIEGRSKNPISLLIDAMTHPGADMGLEWPSLLTWKKTTKSLDHVVLGKGDPGGTWPGIAEHVLTISPGRWMALPGFEFKEYHDKRAPASAVAKYYVDYIKKNDLTSNMVSHSTVTMIQPLTCKSRRRARWKVWVNNSNGSTISYECRHLVLATGASDKAGCLGVPGESLAFVNHDLRGFEEYLSQKSEKVPAVYKTDTVTLPSIDRAETLPVAANLRKGKTGLRSRSNGYSPSGGSLYYSNVLRLSDNIPKHYSGADAGKTNLKRYRKGGSDSVESKDAANNQFEEVRMLGDNEREEGSREVADDGKVGSEVKTTEMDFKKDDEVWLISDIPGETEIDVSLRDLDLNNKLIVKNEMSYSEELSKDERKTVLVVGAGLSAADAILAAWNKDYSVVHAFRSPLTTAQLPSVMYPEYHELYKLMQGLTTRSNYQPLPGHQVTEINKDNSVQLTDSSGTKKTLKVFSVAILIGSQPDLFFLPKSLKNLGIDANKPVDCKVNPIQIDPFSYKCTRAPPGLFALGPLVGDNFVRFLQGGAVAVASHIFKDNNPLKGL